MAEAAATLRGQAKQGLSWREGLVTPARDRLSFHTDVFVGGPSLESRGFNTAGWPEDSSLMALGTSWEGEADPVTPNMPRADHF